MQTIIKILRILAPMFNATKAETRGTVAVVMTIVVIMLGATADVLEVIDLDASVDVSVEMSTQPEPVDEIDEMEVLGWDEVDETGDWLDVENSDLGEHTIIETEWWHVFDEDYDVPPAHRRQP